MMNCFLFSGAQIGDPVKMNVISAAKIRIHSVPLALL
jgi:hypothetical protein